MRSPNRHVITAKMLNHYRNQCRQRRKQRDQNDTNKNSVGNNNNNGSGRTNSNTQNNKTVNIGNANIANKRKDRKPRTVPHAVRPAAKRTTPQRNDVLEPMQQIDRLPGIEERGKKSKLTTRHTDQINWSRL